MSHGGARKGAGRPRGQGQYGEPTKPIRVPISLIGPIKKFVKNKGFQLPLYSSKVQAGYPSPVDDDIEIKLDLNEHVIKHPADTFFVQVSGHSMIDAGIHENDILVVDRSLSPTTGRVVIVAIDGHLTVKRIQKTKEKLFFLPENPAFEPIEIKEGNEVHIWGVVTNVIHSL
jgi:DNA polymerase V